MIRSHLFNRTKIHLYPSFFTAGLPTVALTSRFLSIPRSSLTWMDDHDQYTRDCHTSTLCLIIIEAEAEGVNQLQTERPSQSETKRNILLTISKGFKYLSGLKNRWIRQVFLLNRHNKTFVLLSGLLQFHIKWAILPWLAQRELLHGPWSVCYFVNFLSQKFEFY